MAARALLSCSASKPVISSFFKVFTSSSILRHSSTASSVTLECKGSVAIIKMCKGENRFTPAFFKEYFKALDDIESNKDIKALITTGDGKFYSNGLDLDNFPSYSPEDVRVLFDVNLNTLFKRMLTFPVITIAAINGHSFAGGGLLALTHDYRLMKRERGWFSLPEVLLKMEFSKPLMELAKARLPPSTYTDCILIGKRYTGEEGKAVGIIHEVLDGDKLMERAIELGEEIGQANLDRDTLSQLKNGLNHTALIPISKPHEYYPKL